MSNNQIPENRPTHPEHVHLPFSFEGHYQPWYDDRRDYNTNAPTYYDYLAHRNFLSNEAIKLINRNARRNFFVSDTKSIDLTKNGDWVDKENPCTSKDWQPVERERYYYDDIVEITADLKVSMQSQSVTIEGLALTCPNVLRVLNDGAFVPDYAGFIANLRQRLSSVESELNRLNDRTYTNTDTASIDMAVSGNLNYGAPIDFKANVKVSSNENNAISIKNDGIYAKNLQSELNQAQTKINHLEQALQKIIDNLYNSGAITNNTYNFNFNPNTSIATGNINIYSLTPTGQTLIKTHPTNVNVTGDVTLAVENNSH